MAAIPIHVVKTWPHPFQAMKRGDKSHEVRVDDRNYQPGDVLVPVEYDPEARTFSGDYIVRLITYKTSGGEWGIPQGLCVLSVREVRLGDADVTWQEIARAVVAVQEGRSQ